MVPWGPGAALSLPAGAGLRLSGPPGEERGHLDFSRSKQLWFSCGKRVSVASCNDT